MSCQFFLEVFVQKDLNWLEFTCVNKLVLEREKITRIIKLSWINKFRIHAKIEFYTLHNVTGPSAFLSF